MIEVRISFHYPATLFLSFFSLLVYFYCRSEPKTPNNLKSFFSQHWCFHCLTDYSSITSRCDLRVSGRQHAVPDSQLPAAASGVGGAAAAEPPAGPAASSGPPQQTAACCFPSGGPGAAVASSWWAANRKLHKQNLVHVSKHELYSWLSSFRLFLIPSVQVCFIYYITA